MRVILTQLMIEAVARLLHELAGARILDTTELGNPAAPVLRVTLDNHYDRIGRTVIAKMRRRSGAGWNGDPGYLTNERRALDHLEHLGTELTPRVLTSDEHVVVMTDLGSGPSVQELLIAEDWTSAEAGLIALASAAGTVHAARDFAGFRPARRVPFLDGPLDSWNELFAAATDLGFPSPARASADIEALAKALRGERFRGFTHGDLTPNNAAVVDGVARLFDFEGAGVRHLGIDAGCLRLSFPQYGHWAALPRPVLARMDQAYRGLPAVADDAAYEQLMTEGCLAWAVVRASRLRLIASTDQMVRRRTQIVHTLTAATETARPTGLYPALAEWLDNLVDAMKTRWDEALLQPRGFPAFKPRP
jgi:Phosphotransferase enzyme family